MEHRSTIIVQDAVVNYQNDQATRDLVYGAALLFLSRHRAFTGESIMQSDSTALDALEFLSDLAENVFKFEIE